jgi:predicted permease
VVPARHREFVLGDLEEEYGKRAGGSEFSATWRYWRLALASIAASAFRSEGRRPPKPSRPRGEDAMKVFWRDVVHGLRVLRRRPLFTLTLVIMLGVGIGATTAVFSLANWILLRPVPGVMNARRLVTIEFLGKEQWQKTGISAQNLIDLDAAATTLDGVAGWQPQQLQVMGPDGRAIELSGVTVGGGDYFGVLGVRARLGRLLTAEDSEPGHPSFVAVISSDMWRTMYGADPNVIGKVLRVNRYPLTIVGVARDEFRGVERNSSIDVWFPSSIYAEIRHFPDVERLRSRGAGIFWSGAVGLLAPGATAEAAQAQLRQIMDRLIEAYPEENEEYTDNRPTLIESIGLGRDFRTYMSGTIRVLVAVVALVLVIACANAANMLLFRGVERRGEAAVRRALGATSGRLLRQQAAESLIVGVLASVAGVGVAYAFRALFRGMRMGIFNLDNVPFDGRVLAFALLAAITTSLLFGLVPTALSRRLDMTQTLRVSGRRDTSAKTHVRSAIAVVQLALSLTLLVGAVLLTRTLFNLYNVDLGFDAEHVYAFLTDTEPQGYDTDRRNVFEMALLDRLQQTAAVDAAALTVNAPFAGVTSGHSIRHPDDRDSMVPVKMDWVSAGYFETLNARMLAGRALGPEDRVSGSSGPMNVVVSATLARQLFDSSPAVGRTVALGAREPRDLLIVGVAADKRLASLTGEPEAMVYQPLDDPERHHEWMYVLVRTRLPLNDAEALVRQAVDALDPALPITQVERLSDKVERHLSEERLFARLLVALASIALLMAAVGLYAVIAYGVAQRTREIGIRMALGARRRRVMAMVLKQAGLLAGIGVVLGIAGGLALSRFIESRLFGVEPLDPGVYAAAALLFGVVTLAAAYVPTRRATLIEPVVALRHE